MHVLLVLTQLVLVVSSVFQAGVLEIDRQFFEDYIAAADAQQV